MNTESYQKELNNLRELAVEFSEKHPALAPQLSGPSPDPDVERILEGVAFLTGNIRQKLDDDFPEFAQSLMQMIFPHYLQPLPSSTIIEFTPKSILKSSLVIPKGTFVDSVEVEGTSCRFQTCQDINIAPVNITDVNVEEKGVGKRIIELDINLNSMDMQTWAKDGIDFYIGGDYVGASDVFLLLQHYLTSIDIVVDNSNKVIQLSADKLEALGFDEEQKLIPFPKNGFPAFRTLQEFFLFKEKFLFVRLKGLEAIAKASQLTIKFNLDKVNFKMPVINKQRFTLHASPSINLFEHDAEPIKLTGRQSEIRIIPKKGRGRSVKEHFDIHSIQSVEGNNRRANSRTVYNSISGFYSGGSSTPVYQTSVHSGEKGEAGDTYLTLHYPAQMEIKTNETLSIKMTCSNADLPSQLRPGDINRATSTTSELVEFSNILPPTDSLKVPVGGSLIWRLLSHLSLNFLSLANKENLQALLSLYIFPGSTAKKEETINRKKIAGISTVDIKSADRMVNGNLLRGQEILIELDRDAYSSRGDMILFATMLESLFNSYATFNCFTQVTMKESNTGESYSWPARLGDRPLI
ncbi:type VI secretion system baseplate subunit TssF [Marinicellulosiphila megalodicopiae]|uniref:type VI secretion system baseplate subunit TssF n=1 Tax=Marinicellulosiphila megalodicopiae TaxID=2724896 RepID=UPI003BAF243B